MITERELDILRRFFPVTTGLQAVHTLLRLPDAVAYCDDWEQPHVVAVTRGDHLILAGDAKARGWIEFAASLSFAGFIQAPAAFLPGLKQIDAGVLVWPRVSFVLDGALAPLANSPSSQVRKVQIGDMPGLKKIGQPWLWKFWRDAEDFCRTGVGYVALVDGEAISIASIFTESERYTDLAVATHPGFRRQGYSTAAAHALCKDILAEGRFPVWNTSTDNLASIAIARKLGFREIPAEPLYLMKQDIPDPDSLTIGGDFS
jgi:ribosomal protein S18 acetylase RimI-like enzyme